MVRFLTAMLVASLCACASQYKISNTKYQSSEICCETFSDLPYMKVDQEFSKIFEMQDGKTFEFDTGKSYFRAIEIEESENTMLEIVTFVDLGGLMGYIPKSQVFWPSYITLDKEFNIIRSERNMDLEKGYQFVSFNGKNWGTSLTLNEEEVYVIVYSDKNIYGRKMYVSSVGTAGAYSTGAGTTVSPSSGAIAKHSTLSPGGKIKISVNEAEK